MATVEAEELVFALCHEVGNLLAASRLEAYLLREGADASDIAHAKETISAVSSRSGSLLALIRPLLAPATLPIDSLEAIEVLDRLHRGLDDDCASRVGLEMKAAVKLPDVSVNSDALHHILLTEIYLALDALPTEEAVSVSACARKEDVVFQVEHRAGDSEAEDPEVLSGRSLAVACASMILSANGGSVEVTRDAGTVRVSYRVRAEGSVG